jgi:hypothetical protein
MRVPAAPTLRERRKIRDWLNVHSCRRRYRPGSDPARSGGRRDGVDGARSRMPGHGDDAVLRLAEPAPSASGFPAPEEPARTIPAAVPSATCAADLRGSNRRAVLGAAHGHEDAVRGVPRLR